MLLLNKPDVSAVHSNGGDFTPLREVVKSDSGPGTREGGTPGSKKMEHAPHPAVAFTRHVNMFHVSQRCFVIKRHFMIPDYGQIDNDRCRGNHALQGLA